MATDRPRGERAPADESRAPELTLTRLIDAPRELVFEVWTSAEHLVEWWGPAGFTLPGCDLDFRAGGAFRYRMRNPGGGDHWLRGTFQEIVEPERLAFTFAWGDAEGATGPVTRVTVSFEEQAGKTRVTLHQSGFTTESAARAHEEGWSSQLDRLAAFVVEVFAPSRPA